MKRFVLAALVLAISSLACYQSLPTVEPTVVPSATKLPTVTQVLPTVSQDSANTLSATISQAVVNIRAKPNGAVIGSVEAGDLVTVVDCGEDPKQADFNWCRISKPVVGFVYRGCITELSDELKCQAKP